MMFNLYTLRCLKKHEYGQLKGFIEKYWSKSHVFCRSKEIFEFQHGDANAGEYDFVIALHNETNEIHAVLGFITSSRYNEDRTKDPDFIAGAFWKVREDIHNNEIGKLGLGVLYYLIKKYPRSVYITLGLSQNSLEIYKALHFEYGTMGHFYLASDRVKDFKIAENPIVNYESVIDQRFELKVIKSVPINFDSYYYPVKNAKYIENRYVKHPVYKYELLGVFMKTKLLSIWIVRKIVANRSACIRIVDIIGNIQRIPDIEGNLQEYLLLNNAEYIDCYNHGIDESAFYKIGFKKVSGREVIPNYFEPFERKNVDIHYAAYPPKNVVVFKGDGDQDRPSLLD